MARSKRWPAAGAALLIAVVAAGPGAAQVGLARVARAQAVTLRVGYFPNITHAQAILGFGDGIFARDLPGVSVQGQVFNAGPDEMNAIFAGAVDIGYIGPGPAINGYVRSGGAVVIVAGGATGGAELVARAGEAIKSVRDLAGKTVAVPQLGNTQDIELRGLLKAAGLAPTESGGTVRIIAVQNPDTLTLFKKKAIDAALVPEPWGSRLVKQTGASFVLDWRQIYGGVTPATVIVVSSSFLKAHRDVVVRFLRAHDQITRELRHPAAVEGRLNADLAKLAGKPLPAAVLALALQKTIFTTQINQLQLSQFAQLSVSAGYLKSGANLAGVIDPWPLAHLTDSSIK